MASPDDFDPTHVLDGWRVPAPAPLEDLELDQLLKAGGSSLDAAKRARMKARGFDVDDVQDVEPRPSRGERPTRVEAPLLDLRFMRSPTDRRVLPKWQPLAWIALARRVRGASAEVVQAPGRPLVVENHAPQWLCALWPPQRVDAPLLSRWPDLAMLVSAETLFGALHQVLAELPPDAVLWPAQLDVDWALLAELVLHHDAGLRPAQVQALRELAEAERRAALARINDGYARHGRLALRRARGPTR
jgi:hypothetical protein